MSQGPKNSPRLIQINLSKKIIVESPRIIHPLRRRPQLPKITERKSKQTEARAERKLKKEKTQISRDFWN